MSSSKKSSKPGSVQSALNQINSKWKVLNKLYTKNHIDQKHQCVKIKETVFKNGSGKKYDVVYCYTCKTRARVLCEEDVVEIVVIGNGIDPKRKNWNRFKELPCQL